MIDFKIGELVTHKIDFTRRIYKVTDRRSLGFETKILDLTYGGESWWATKELEYLSKEKYPEYFL